jgi:hypothetical protein
LIIGWSCYFDTYLWQLAVLFFIEVNKVNIFLKAGAKDTGFTVGFPFI